MVKKRPRRVILLLAIALVVVIILAFIIFLGSQSGQVAVPGVKEGDEFTYDVMGFWSSNDPNATLPESFLQLNMTEWYKITVTGVSDAQVSIDTTWRFTNETELTGQGTVNVQTGICYPSDGFWAIYASNLRANDRLRPLGPDQSTINETTTRDYADGTRETNRISLVLQYYDADDPTYSTTWTEYMNTHFDRNTGMLVELRDTNVYTNPQMTLIISWKIKDSNVWAVPEFPSVLILPLFMIVTLFAVIVHKKKRTSNTKTLIPA
jgi:hypothetical protein